MRRPAHLRQILLWAAISAALFLALTASLTIATTFLDGKVRTGNTIDIPAGETPAHRSDVEVWFDKLPEPIDLELDRHSRVMYWTDRGDPPQGNTVNRAPVDGKPAKGQAPEILLTHLMEGIGIALDVPGDRMFLTDLGGSVYSARLDGSDKRAVLVAQGNLSGIAYAEI